jgi:alpha-D-ribose 1-methylphosphonate 5-triphosphate synthase subunit PhnG
MDWKERLGSRKLWTTLISIVAIVGAAFGFSEATLTQAAAILTAGGVGMTYIFGQSKVDVAKEENSFNNLSKAEVTELLKGWMEANDESN